MFLLDICCQLLENICNFEGFCGPFGPRVGEICNFEDFCWGKVHILLDLCCQHLRLYVNWGVSVGPSSPGLGNLHFLTLSSFLTLQGQGTMHIRTLCSGSIAFSSLVTSSNLINQFLFASSRMENFLYHFLASSRTSLSMSKNLEMTITISESQQILHCFISQVLRLLAAGTKITSF